MTHHFRTPYVCSIIRTGVMIWTEWARYVCGLIRTDMMIGSECQGSGSLLSV